MEARGIDSQDYSVVAVPPREMPSYLSAGDAGLAFVKPCFSKLASSPTKYAEYLGCGLPLIINAGIGDSDALINRENVGALVSSFDEKAYAEAWVAMDNFNSDQEATRKKSRAVAERLFDVKLVGVQGYARLYRRVLSEN